MLKDLKIHQIIGISGAARSGKDTLCRGLIRVLKEKYNVDAIRKSIAGDRVKADLKNILAENVKIDAFTENNQDKEYIRPLLIEYGKLMRNKTEGRYFIENFKIDEQKVNIIPDIRYAEYPKDEVFWIKNEIKGFLIFIERKNIYDANDTEKINNKIIKQVADYHLTWDSLDENSEYDRKLIDFYASEVLNKMFTIYQPDNVQLLNTF